MEKSFSTSYGTSFGCCLGYCHAETRIDGNKVTVMKIRRGETPDILIRTETFLKAAYFDHRRKIHCHARNESAAPTVVLAPGQTGRLGAAGDRQIPETQMDWCSNQAAVLTGNSSLWKNKRFAAIRES